MTNRFGAGTMVAGLLQIIWSTRPTMADGSAPGHEFFGSRLMKAIFRPRCNKFRHKFRQKATVQRVIMPHNPRQYRTAFSTLARISPEILPAGGLAKRAGSSERS
jgi:hypothetical protein